VNGINVMCCREAVAATKWGWKPHRVYARLTTTGVGHTVDASYVLLPAKTPITNQTVYRTPLSRPRAVITLLSGHGGVLGVAGLPARSHTGGSFEKLVDGILVTVLVIFIAVVVAAVVLARRRRRAVAASRACDDYDEDDDCVELGEFVTEWTHWSHDDVDTTHQGISSPVGSSVDDDDKDDASQVLGDITSLTPLCEPSTSSAASSVASGSTPPDTPLF